MMSQDGCFSGWLDPWGSHAGSACRAARALSPALLAGLTLSFLAPLWSIQPAPLLEFPEECHTACHKLRRFQRVLCQGQPRHAQQRLCAATKPPPPRRLRSSTSKEGASCPQPPGGAPGSAWEAPPVWERSYPMQPGGLGPQRPHSLLSPLALMVQGLAGCLASIRP